MFKLTKDQEAARAAIESWLFDGDSSMLALSGPAGTGKTTILRELDLGPSVLWTAMTGKAALRLGQQVGEYASTLHRELYYPPSTDRQKPQFDRVREPPLLSTVLVVDECSMVTPTIFNDLLIWTVSGGVRILFVGDAFQLPPVLSAEEEKLYGRDFTVFGRVDGPELSCVVRSVGDICKVATHLRERREIVKESVGAYRYVTGDLQRAVEEWLSDPEDHAIITWRNEVRMRIARRLRRELGREGGPQPGEPILFCRNGYGALNGEIGSFLKLEDGPELGPIKTWWLTVREKESRVLVTLDGKVEFMDGHMPFFSKDDWLKYRAARRDAKLNDPVPITWGYALTAHKAQGSEFRRATVYLDAASRWSKSFSAPSKLPRNKGTVPFWVRWLYTALTRAKEQATLIIGE